MEIGNLSHDAANEAYCLIAAYIREDRVVAKYNKKNLQEFQGFLHKVLKNPQNFNTRPEETSGEDEEIAILDTGTSPPSEV